jgi:beta-galactosidase/beta-glucuronidase
MAADAHGYPRPQLVRANWQSLNGTWEFAREEEPGWRGPHEVPWGARIEVPFAPETPASSVGDTGFHAVCWYRRAFTTPTLAPGARLLLHFGAVDYATTVWVNGVLVARHEGGYTPFHADITDALVPQGPQTVVVRAEDDPHDLAKPRGKQDWLRDAHAIWYWRTSGIWQTVWLEAVPATRIGTLHWTPDVPGWAVRMEATIAGAQRDDLYLRVTLVHGDRTLADDTCAVTEPEIIRAIALHDPGIGDARNELLWSPERPTLIEARLELLTARGDVLDSVESYAALRSVGVQGDRFTLNGRPFYLRMALDQGYWPESGLTAPDDAALREDVELAKAMGLNGVRKHQKIEDPRYLYWADRLGLLVWEEMPSAYRFSATAVERTTREWTEAIRRDRSHPCIVAWVPFNESWGVPDLPAVAAQRDYVRALYFLTKTLDPTRLVIGNDGWEHVETDLLTLHDYDADPDRLGQRYRREQFDTLWDRGLPAGRLISLAEHPHIDCPVLLTEFGGIAFSADASTTWGYSRSESAEEFADRYRRLLEVVRNHPLFAGFCYTQFTDTYQESNGLLYMDRTPKFPLEEIAAANRG